MTVYFVMIPKPDENGDIMGITYKRDHAFRSWVSGNPFSDNKNEKVYKRHPVTPIPISLKEGREDDPPADYLAAPLPLLSAKLRDILRSVGVDNLDTYDVELTTASGEAVQGEYYAFNLVGKVSALDLDRTVMDTEQSDSQVSASIDSVAIDDEKVKGLLMFRLAENVSTVIVDAKVKEAVEAAGIKTVEFVLPESYATL